MKWLTVLIFPLLVVACNSRIDTPLEKNEYSKFTNSNELKEFVKEVSAKSNVITLIDSATTVFGNKIFLTKVEKKNNLKNKLKVLIFAQQHGNEQSGKEAILEFYKKTFQGEIDNIENLVLYIIPQVNPDGSDSDKRRNQNDFDLNRDHLVLSQPETQFLKSVFLKYLPEAVLDIHEYYPYSKKWMEFGYIKNFDVQFGSLTNPNIDPSIQDLSEKEFFPFISEYLSAKNVSHHKYIVGGPPNLKRIRYSTTDINDGRQSTGIYNTFSFILEGKNGFDANDNLRRRTETQYLAIAGWLTFLNDNYLKIKTVVEKSRENIQNSINDEITIRQEHYGNGEKKLLKLKSVQTKADTTIEIDNFHTKIQSLLSIKKPKAYLIEKKDTKLTKWLKKNGIVYSDLNNTEVGNCFSYRILNIKKSIDEELENIFPEVEIIREQKINKNDYLFISTNQIAGNFLTIALEPQSMFGLVQYDDFKYLIEGNKYQILRVE